MVRVEAADRVTGQPWSVAEWLTVERVLYGIIAVAALGLRLHGLASQPLVPAEAVQALPAAQAATGVPYSLVGISPLLFGLQRLLFTPFGASDALARWWPALLGGGATLLFYALRDRLTRGGALMAAFLWAISPMAVFVGRLGLGFGLVPPLALALLAGASAAARHLDPAAPDAAALEAGEANDPTTSVAPRSSTPLLMASVALGLLLAAGAGAYTVVLAGLAAVLFWAASLSAFTHAAAAQRRALLPGVLLAFGLGATCFMTATGGLAAAADLLGAWLRGLAPGPGVYPPWDILRRLLLSEPLLVGLGVAGAVQAYLRRDRLGLYLGAVAVLALIVSLFGSGRNPADLGLVVLALALLSGPPLARALRSAWSWRDQVDPWLLLSLSTVLLVASSFSLPGVINALVVSAWRQIYLGVAISTLALGLLLWLVYGVWGSWRTVAMVFPIVPLAFGLAWNVSQTVGLSYDHAAGQRPAVLIDMPDPGMRDMRSALLQLSALVAGGTRESRVDLVLPEAAGNPIAPMLRWSLRDYAKLRVVTAVPADPAPLVITPDEPQLLLSTRYSGSEFNILQQWRPDGLQDFSSWAHWILYRQASTVTETFRVVLWANRTDKAFGIASTTGN